MTQLLSNSQAEIAIEKKYAQDMASILKSPNSLKLVKKQTDEMVFSAVTQDGLTLKYAQNQTDDITLAAVLQNGLALEFVKNKTDKISLAAVSNCGLALCFVEMDNFTKMHGMHRPSGR
jgi:hypothetical protein